ncbi:MAG TPA: hypothetical protein VFW22_15235 [Pseudolabrys sp.]|nr:hypothetical protein [Pseudolabrys sp.]
MSLRLGVSLAIALVSLSAAAQDKKAGSKATISRPMKETVIYREVFTGNESRIAYPNWVNTDCSSGPVPDLRISTAPKNGELRMEEITVPVDRAKDNSRFGCNGKPVKAVGVYYKSKAGYTGPDNVVIDVDFKTGTVSRYNYKITVR